MFNWFRRWYYWYLYEKHKRESIYYSKLSEASKKMSECYCEMHRVVEK